MHLIGEIPVNSAAFESAETLRKICAAEKLRGKKSDCPLWLLSVLRVFSGSGI